MKRKYTLRKFFTDVHLWLGLGSGLVLFVVCLTGTIYTFRAEIERAINSSKYYSKADSRGPKLSVDIIAGRLEKQFKGKVTSFLIPADPTMNYQVGIKPEAIKERPARDEKTNTAGRSGEANQMKRGPARGGEERGERAEVRPVTYLVNPYTGVIAGDLSGGGSSKFFATVLQLHRWLLMEHSIGTLIVGISTAIFVFIILSGLVIWLPKRMKNLKDGLRIKFSANWKRINHDLHNVLGFYSMLILLVMALTGLCWSFEWYRDGLSKVMGAKVFGGRNEKPMQSASTPDSSSVVPLSSHIARANELFSYPGDIRVTLPAASNGAVVVSKNKTGFFAFSGADKVQLDRFTGKELKVERFSSKPLNKKIVDSIRPLHTGEIYGLFSKILYFIACLIATSLPVTGTIIWINKFKKKAKRNVQVSTGSASEVFSAT